MKIALLIDSMNPGGSERTVQILANILVGQKYEVAVFSLANIWHYTLHADVKRAHIYEQNFSFAKKIALLPFTYRKLKRQILDFDPALVISFTPHANMLNALLRRNRRIRTISGERQYAEDYYGKKNILARPMIRWMHNRVDAVIANDAAIEHSLRSYYGVVKPIFVLNNLFDASVLSVGHKKPDEGERNAFRYITVGRLSTEKNTKDLIKAMALLHDKEPVLEIIGDGPLRPELEKLTETLGLKERVFFRGHQKNPFQFLERADAFVFSSLNEGFPNVILEAMACGLPVISYHFKSGINTILEGGKNGALIKIGDVRAMAEAMQEIKDNPDLRNYYIGRSKETVERFSNREAYLAEVEQIIKKITDKK